MSEAIAVSHWDVDGVIAAALLVRMLGVDYMLATPLSLSTILREALDYKPSTIILCDVAPSPKKLQKLEQLFRHYTSSGGRIVVLDHHEWPRRLIEIENVEAIVDTSRSSASEIVAEWLKSKGYRLGGYEEKLVEVAVDDELFRNRVEEAVMWRRMLRWYDWSFRYRAVEAIAQGGLMPEWARQAYREMIGEYMKAIRKAIESSTLAIARGLTIVVIDAREEPLNRLHPGDLHEEAYQRYGDVDLYVIVYPSGFSLRSTRINVDKIARRLGGGGHEKAAGVPYKCNSIDEILEAIVKAV